MKTLFSLQFFLTPILFFTVQFSHAQIEVAQLFSDNMVLQRDQEIPIWGWAEQQLPLEVTVTFQGASYTSKSDGKTRKWTVELPPMKAGGPYEMRIGGGGKTIVLQNILIGDVWICSGQSNMEWTVQFAQNPEIEIANAKDPQIRHFKVKKGGSQTPEHKIPESGIWQVCSPETVGNFTAVGYFFARDLRAADPSVPIGLLHSSWGGSSVEAWMSAEALGMDNPYEAFQKLEEKFKEERDKLLLQLEKIHGKIPTEDAGWSEDEKALWAAPPVDDADWKTMNVPQLWEEQSLPDFDGIVWYRKSFELTEEEAKAGITLGLGSIDDSDWSYVNGRKIGSMIQSYNTPRVYEVNTQHLKAGKNTITVRVEDTGGGGGFHGATEAIYLKTNNRKISLAGEWKYKIGAMISTSIDSRVHQTPTMLYNHMLHPLIGYGIKGVIWYQGETNASPNKAFQYRQDFSNMIQYWRERWQQGDFPFLFVQLANFMPPPMDANTQSSWAVLRESQTQTLDLVPNTAQAVIIDIGEADDIHPRNKQDVGKRLALAAQKLAYGKEVVYSGPTYQSHQVESNKVSVQFNHIGGGLIVKDKYGYVKAFTIAGEDGIFHWAKAKIEGDKVIVWSEKVTNPVHIRYAWADNPNDANLYNAEGLPACPFRTDRE